MNLRVALTLVTPIYNSTGIHLVNYNVLLTKAALLHYFIIYNIIITESKYVLFMINSCNIAVLG